jgi:fatty acid desaturase 2 (delta-6 desaturase)
MPYNRIMDALVFASPFIFNGILAATYCLKGLIGPINPLFHNYNMTFQSCVLLCVTMYSYYDTANQYQLPLTDFIAISNKGCHNNVAMYIFLASKLWEWLDTMLLIVNNKKIISLHWWHHSTIVVAFYTGFNISSVYWIGGLNSFIHIIMYLYYADVQFIKPYARYLTQLQIVQLFGGVYMNYVSYYHNTDERLKRFSLINGAICLSYGLMFLQFYATKYKKKDNKKEKVEKERKTVIIDNCEYDITNFDHPGGNVIFYYAKGQDATEAFNEFHQRSKKARLVLKSLPHQELPKTRDFDDKEMLADFKRFRQELVDEGYFQPNLFHVSYRICELVGLFGLAAYLIPHSIIASVVVFGLFGGRCGWLQHEGGHNSLTNNIPFNKLIQKMFIGFGLHVSGSMWNKMHNKHHATPQKVKYDIDLDTTPLVAFFDTALEANRSRPLSKSLTKWWLKYQKYTFLPITSGIIVPFFWAFYLHPREILLKRDWIQAAFILLGEACRIGLFMMNGYSVLHSVLLNCATTWVSDVYLFGHFSLSHTFTPIIDEDDNPSWVRYAVEHSVDIVPQNPAVSWIMGYLNCQVIHHLFPSMPQYHGPAVSKRLISFCKKWDIKYTIVGYGEAWQLMFKNLDDVGKQISSN